MNPPQTNLPVSPNYYEIRVREQIGGEKRIWFDEFTITQAETGECVLRGSVPDQSALHGLLAKIRDLNLTLISINSIEPKEK